MADITPEKMLNIIRKAQIKTTMRYRFKHTKIPIIFFKWKRSGKDVNKLEPSCVKW